MAVNLQHRNFNNIDKPQASGMGLGASAEAISALALLGGFLNQPDPCDDR